MSIDVEVCSDVNVAKRSKKEGKSEVSILMSLKTAYFSVIK